MKNYLLANFRLHHFKIHANSHAICAKKYFFCFLPNFFGKMASPQPVKCSISNFWYYLTQPNVQYSVFDIFYIENNSVTSGLNLGAYLTHLNLVGGEGMGRGIQYIIVISTTCLISRPNPNSCPWDSNPPAHFSSIVVTIYNLIIMSQDLWPVM